MTDNVNAEIIAIGTELLLGEIADTNSVFMAQQLRNLGINLYYMTSVGDNEERIANAIELALSRADVVITCGGLGPTVDDMTRQGVALATQRELVFSQNLYDQIAARFASFNVKMSDNNRRQAYLPKNAMPLENPVGTAPSFIVEQDDKCVISIPGVPREMKFLFTERVIPYLRERYHLGIIKARVLKTAGIGESSLDEMLGTELLESRNPSIGLAAHHGVIDIRMTAKASDEATADTMLDTIERDVLNKAGDFIFGKDDDELEQVVVDLLQARHATLAVVEAGITGAVIDRLQPNGNHVLAYAAQYQHPRELYTNDATELRDIATTLVEDITKIHNAQAGIVLLSLPEVTENSDVDTGTVIAVYANGKHKIRTYGFGAKSDFARDWATRWSLSYVWRELKEQNNNVE